MRLIRLNLTRYGKFTDFGFDFGPLEPGQPDLHVIYGPNEAGKTTTLTAFLDLLFGIERHNPYHFLHDANAMEIGGVLQFASGVYEFRRVKKLNGSLLDSMGRPLPDGAILDEIGGLGRADYKLKFSLDADTLEKGGENILASKGDLGQLLFAASAGIADLSGKLDGLREECDQFYKKRAQKTELAELRRQLDQLAEEKGRLDTLAKKYRDLLSAHDEADGRYRKALEERTQATTEKAQIESLEAAMPRLDVVKKVTANLLALEHVPLIAPGLRDRILQLKENEIRLDSDFRNALAAIEDLSAKIDDIDVEETALAMTDRLAGMAEAKHRFNGAVSDIPKLRPQVQTLSETIAGILYEIGRRGEANPDSLFLEARVTVPLRDLIKAESGVLARRETAQDELTSAKERLDKETAKLSLAQSTNCAGDSASFKILAALVADIRKAALETVRHQAARASNARFAVLNDKMKPLAPWRGGPDDLPGLRVPDAAEIERWKLQLEAAEKAHSDHKDGVERLKDDLAELCAQRDASVATAGVVSDADATNKRADREAAWAEHRRILSLDTANAFESKLRTDDLAVTARFSHVSEIAKVNRTLEDIAIKAKGLEHAETRLEVARLALDDARRAIAASIRAVSADFPQTTIVAEFASWASRFCEATKAREEANECARALRDAEDDIASASNKLAAAMAKAGAPHEADMGLDAMLLSAEAAIETAKSAHIQAEAVESAQRDYSKRQTGWEEAKDAADRWTKQWRGIVASCWIGDTHSHPTTSLVGEILTKLVELKTAFAERAALEERIDKMERDRKNFEQDVQTLAADMNEETGTRPIMIVYQALEARVKRANDRNQTRNEKIAELAEAKLKEKREQDKMSAHLEELQTIFGQLRVETLPDAVARLDEAKTKSDLLARKAEEEGYLLKGLGVASIEEAEAALEEIHLAELSTQKAAAENRFGDSDERQRQHFSEKARFADQIEAIGGDDAVALIEEKRRAVCLEIEDKARRWLRMRVGIVAAEQALRLYREKHRSSMLANASNAFATISRGAYSKLTTAPDGANEALVGIVANDGGSRAAKEMSKGTRFQLYLALRVAGYQEYASSRQPPSGVPFVADDIMETFDDGRAEEALGLMARMAEIGQVIYLTHHEHLCAIAKKVCPSVKLHSFR